MTGSGPGEPPAGHERDGTPRWVRLYFEDSGLWPVLIVVLAHIVLFMALAILFSVRDRLPYGIAALALAAIGTVDLVLRDLRRGTLGLLARTLLICWLLAAGVATAAHHYHLL